ATSLSLAHELSLSATTDLSPQRDRSFRYPSVPDDTQFSQITPRTQRDADAQHYEDDLLSSIQDLEDKLAAAEDHCSTLEYQNQCLKVLLKSAQSNKGKRRASRVILFPEGY